MTEIKSKWDYPDKDGFYWVFDKEFNKLLIAEYNNGKFFAAGTDEIKIEDPNSFNYYLKEVTKYKRITKPKN